MNCEKCGLDGYIQQKELVFTGDDRPDIQTQAFYRLHFYCQNPNCTEYGREIGVEDVEIT